MQFYNLLNKLNSIISNEINDFKLGFIPKIGFYVNINVFVSNLDKYQLLKTVFNKKRGKLPKYSKIGSCPHLNKSYRFTNDYFEDS
jgi:hypothetical protein